MSRLREEIGILGMAIRLKKEDIGILAEQDDIGAKEAQEIAEYELSILEKQQPVILKALNCFDEHYGRVYECPVCGWEMIGIRNYCAKCGQKLEYCEKK